jgi:hypothetical protein
MTRRVAAVVGLLVLVNGTAPHAQQPASPARDNPQNKPAMIRGRVFAADSGRPLRKARVRLTSTDDTHRGARFENRTATTDAEGQYEFSSLPAGRYRLTAMKGSYVSLEFGQRRPFEQGKPIDVRDGQTLEKVDFALPQGGVMTGHVFDEFGDPSANVSISAMRYQFDRHGRRRLAHVGGTTTNDLGEFRLFALAPGEYYVLATFHMEPGDTNDRSVYAPIYYPGTADPNLAQRLTVAIGQTVGDLSLTLLPVRTVRITGTAVDSEGRPIPGILLVEPSHSSVFSMNNLSALVQPDGSFTGAGLTAGEYRLVVRAVPMLGLAESVTASAEVTVGGDDLTGVRLVAGKPVAASGRVVVSDTRAAQSLRPSTLRVIATSVDEETFETFSGDSLPAVNDDWSFHLKLPPGRTRLFVVGTPPGWDVKEVRFRGTDVTDAGLDVKPNEDLANIEIELTNRVTETTGLVTDQRGEPVKDYSVVIFARDRQKWEPPSRAVRTARSDQEGRFKIGGLPSGEYLACAIDFLEPGQENDLEFLDRIQTLATRFSLSEGEMKLLNLKLNAAP